MKSIVQHLKVMISDDLLIGDNSRRIYLQTELLTGSVMAVYQDSSNYPEELKGGGIYQHGSLYVTTAQYNALVKDAKEAGKYYL